MRLCQKPTLPFEVGFQNGLEEEGKNRIDLVKINKYVCILSNVNPTFIQYLPNNFKNCKLLEKVGILLQNFGNFGNGWGSKLQRKYSYS